MTEPSDAYAAEDHALGVEHGQKDAAHPNLSPAEIEQFIGDGDAYARGYRDGLARARRIDAQQPSPVHALLSHHVGVWSLYDGECGCECPLCWVGCQCVCPDCTWESHDHSRRQLAPIREVRHGVS